MAIDIAKLVVSLEAESYKLRTELDRANKKLDGFGKQADRAVAKATKSFKSLAGVLTGGYLAVGFQSLVRGTLDTADALAKTADKVGITTDLLQELNFAADRSGVSTEQLSTNMTAFVKRVGEAKSGVGPLIGFLKKYDQQLLENITNAKTQEEALNLVAEAIRNAKTPTEQAAIANAAFSRAGVGMVNMLRDGKEGLDGLRGAARDAGVVIEEDLLRATEKLNDQWGTFTNSIRTKVQVAVLETAQVVGYLSDEIKAMFGVINQNDITRLEEQAAKIRKVMEGGIFAAGERLRFFGKKGIVEYYDDDELQAELAEVEAKIADWYAEQAKSKDERPPIIVPEVRITEDMVKARDELEKFAEALTRSHDPASVAAEKLRKIEEAMAAGLITADVYSDAITETVEEWQKSLEAVDEEALRAQEQMERFAKSLTEAHDPAAVAAERLRQIEEAMESGMITAAVYAEAIKATVEEWQDALDVVDENEERMKEIKATADEVGDTFASAFEDAIVGGESLKDTLKSLEDDLLRLFTRKMITEPLSNAISGIFMGAAGGAGGTAPLPSFAGGGFTGIGGRSGGLDGQGGFLAMLHPRETVLDHAKGQTMGGVTVVQNITTPDADSFRKSERQTARDARLAFGGV